MFVFHIIIKYTIQFNQFYKQKQGGIRLFVCLTEKKNPP